MTENSREIKKLLKKEKRRRRGNLQGCGCILIVASIVLGISIVGLPISGPLFLIGLVILVIGFLV